MKLVSWILTLTVLLLALSFALHNSQTVTVSLWPLDAEVMAPVYILAIGTLFVGLLIGALFGWAIHVPHRMEARRLRRHNSDLRDELDDLRKHAETADANNGNPLLLTRTRLKRKFWKRRL